MTPLRCEQVRTSHYVDCRLQRSRLCASKGEQVLCSSWNRTKVAQILEEEQPLSTFAANRKASGPNDSTVFDYCNCSSQPADQDIIDSLRLNPKVSTCCFADGAPSLNCVPVMACMRVLACCLTVCLRCTTQAALYKHVFDSSTPLHHAVLHGHRSRAFCLTLYTILI